MESIATSEKDLNESFSRKEVTFSDKYSLLYYSVGGSVDSLNNSVIQTLNNDKVTHSSEISNIVKNSSNIMGSDSKCVSQCLSNLPEAVIILEKLPEALVEKHTYPSHVELMPIFSNNNNAPLNSDSPHFQKTTETSAELINNKYPLKNFKLPIQRLPDKVREIYESYKNDKDYSTVDTCTEKHQDTTEKNQRASRQPFLENPVELPSTEEICNKVSFDKYPCVHLEKLNLALPVITDIEGVLHTLDFVSNENSLYPRVHLEKLNLSLPVIMDTEMNENSVAAETNVPNSPIQIESAISISRKQFNKIEKHKKSPKQSSLCLKKDKHKKRAIGAIKHKPSHANSFGSLESFSKNTSPTFNLSISKDNFPLMSFSRKGLNNTASFDNSPSSDEDNYPLISLSKEKLSESFHDSSSEDVSFESLSKFSASLSAEPKTESLRVTSQKHKNNSPFTNVPLVSILKTNSSLSIGQKTKSLPVKSHKHENNSTFTNVPLVSILKTNSSLSIGQKTKSLPVKSHKHKKKSIHPKVMKSNANHTHATKSKKKHSMHDKSKFSPSLNKIPSITSNKLIKMKKESRSDKLSTPVKKKSKKSLKKKQMKVYKMVIKYLKKQLSKKHKKKSKNKKSNQKNSKGVNLTQPMNEINSGSDDSIDVIFDSRKENKDKSQNKNSEEEGETSAECREASQGTFSCSSKNKTKVGKTKKLVDKYRLGFLSNKFSLRFYNRFLASERLLLSTCNIKKGKKKVLKRLFQRLKSVGLSNY